MGRIRPEPLLMLVAVLAAASGASARERGANPLGLGALGGKEPITVTADRLEYDYKGNVVTYRGSVEVIQGQTKLKSDTITITLSSAKPAAEGAPPPADPGSDTAARVQEIVATGSVRIDQGARWATGGRAVFDQTQRTLVLSENPVLHDGPNEVQGDRVVVFLDEDRSVVEGGRKRVKAVLYPDQENKKPGGEATPEASR